MARETAAKRIVFDIRFSPNNFRAVRRSLQAFSPEVMCRCTVDKNAETFLSHLTKPWSKAGGKTSMKSSRKHVHIVHAFHPSVLTKDRDRSATNDVKAELDRALLLFCFSPSNLYPSVVSTLLILLRFCSSAFLHRTRPYCCSVSLWNCSGLLLTNVKPIS